MSSVQGFYHHALLRIMLAAYAENLFTQESLAREIGRDQKTAGNYINRKKTLDLDEAEAALRHVGSSLSAFVSDPANATAIARHQEKASPEMKKLMAAVRGFGEPELAVVVATARSVRAKLLRAKKQSASPRAAGRQREARKTGGTR